MLVSKLAVGSYLVLLAVIGFVVRDWCRVTIANYESERERVRRLRNVRHNAYSLLLVVIPATGVYLEAFRVLAEPWPRVPPGAFVDGFTSFLLLCYLPLVGGLAVVYGTAVPYVNVAKDRTYPRHRAVVDFVKLCLVRSILPVGLVSILLLFPPGIPTGAAAALFFALFAAFSPAINRVASDVRPPTETEREIFESIDGPDDVDLVVVAASDAKQALGAAVGIVPGHRDVVLTDYLVDELDRRQVRAVLAHEFGHHEGSRQWYVGFVVLLVGSWFGAWSAVEGSFLLWGLGGFAVYELLTRAVRRRMEYRADTAAANEVGAEAMADALDELASANGRPREFGTVSQLFQNHPSLDDRIERLRARRS